MKILLLLLLAGLSWASNFPGTTGFYRFENNLNDTSGVGGTGTFAGTFAYVTAGAVTFGGGTTAVQNDFDTGTHFDAPLACINKTIGQVEFAWRTSGVTLNLNQMLWWGGGDGATNSRVIELHYLNNGYVMLENNTASCIGVTPTVLTNTQYYYMIRWNGSVTEYWLGTGYNVATNTVTGRTLLCTGAAPTWGTVNANRFFNGFNDLDKAQPDGMDNVRFLNTWNDNWPSNDTPEGTLSPYVENSTTPYMMRVRK